MRGYWALEFNLENGWYPIGTLYVTRRLARKDCATMVTRGSDAKMLRVRKWARVEA